MVIWYLSLPLGLRYTLGLVIAPLIVALVGFGLEFCLRRTYGKKKEYGLLLTFGAALVIEETIRLIWGPVEQFISVPSAVSGAFIAGDMIYSTYRIYAAVFGVFAILLVWLFLDKTPYGAIIKAGAHDSEMVRALGINLPRLQLLVFGFGAALAAVAGIILTPIWGLRPHVGVDAVIPAFLIIVLGGIGSFWGAVSGGLLVGLAVGLTGAYASDWSMLSMYLLLDLRPEFPGARPVRQENGVGGLSDVDCADIELRLSPSRCWRFSPSCSPIHYGLARSGFMTIWASRSPSSFSMRSASIFCLAIRACRPSDTAPIWGSAPMPYGLAQVHLDAGLFPGLILAILAGAIASGLVACFLSHRRGIYFALMTIAFGQVFWFLALKLHSVTGGEDGLLNIFRPTIELGFVSFSLKSNAALFYLVAILLTIVVLALWRLVHSPFGTALRAIHMNETRARFVGYRVWLVKWTVFSLSGAIAGLAGGLFCLAQESAYPDVMSLHQSGFVVMMTLIGGGFVSFWGPVVGAIIFFLARDLLGSITETWLLWYGLLFMGVMLFEPEGIAGAWGRLVRRFKGATPVGRIAGEPTP